MEAYKLFDSRSFCTKFEMALSILARKRPAPTQEEQGEAFQPIVDHILALAIQSPQHTPLAPQGNASALPPLEVITPTDNEKDSAGPLQALINKVVEAGAKSTAPTFPLVFSKSEGMHVQALPMYLEATPYFIADNKGFTPSVNGWVVTIGRK